MRNYQLAALIRKLLVNWMSKHKSEVLTVKIQLKVKFPLAVIYKIRTVPPVFLKMFRTAVWRKTRESCFWNYEWKTINLCKWHTFWKSPSKVWFLEPPAPLSDSIKIHWTLSPFRMSHIYTTRPLPTTTTTIPQKIKGIFTWEQKSMKK